MKTFIVSYLVLFAFQRLLCATYTWTGNGANGLWSRPENWQNNIRPPANSTVTLVFPSSSNQSVSTNDIAGLLIDTWTVKNGGIFHGVGVGNAITLSGDIKIYNLNSTLSSSITFTLLGNCHIRLLKDINQTYPDLVLRSRLTGSGSMTYHGRYSQFYDSSTVEIRPPYSNDYTGTTWFDGGIYELSAGRMSGLPSPGGVINAISFWTPAIAVPGKCVIGGVGDNIDGNATQMHLESSGQIGNSSYVIVHESSSLDLDRYTDTIGQLLCRGDLWSEIRSTSTFGRLVVQGTVTLDSSTSYLGISADPAYVPGASDNLRIIDNDGLDAVSGKFSNRNEASNLTLNGAGFKFSYVGGTGNDVTVKRP